MGDKGQIVTILTAALDEMSLHNLQQLQQQLQ